jgi:hypothetical protein
MRPMHTLTALCATLMLTITFSGCSTEPVMLGEAQSGNHHTQLNAPPLTTKPIPTPTTSSTQPTPQSITPQKGTTQPNPAPEITTLPPQAGQSSNQHPRIEQGMHLVFKNNYDAQATGCTLGFIDQQRRMGYAAAHCVPGTITNVYQDGGAEVYTADGQRVGTAYPMLTFAPAYAADKLGTAEDLSVIYFEDNAALQPNRFSGNTVIPKADINPETDTFCVYGATTRATTCGQLLEALMSDLDDNIITIEGVNVAKGDSGGPMWKVDDQGNPQGLVGIIHGWYSEFGENAVGPILYEADGAKYGALPGREHAD